MPVTPPLSNTVKPIKPIKPIFVCNGKCQICTYKQCYEF